MHPVQYELRIEGAPGANPGCELNAHRVQFPRCRRVPHHLSTASSLSFPVRPHNPLYPFLGRAIAPVDFGARQFHHCGPFSSARTRGQLHPTGHKHPTRATLPPRKCALRVEISSHRWCGVLTPDCFPPLSTTLPLGPQTKLPLAWQWPICSLPTSSTPPPLRRPPIRLSTLHVPTHSRRPVGSRGWQKHREFASALLAGRPRLGLSGRS